MERLLCFCILALVTLTASGCSPMRGVEYQPWNFAARWTGVGYSDGYHRCPLPEQPRLAHQFLLKQRCDCNNCCVANAMPSAAPANPPSNFGGYIPLPGTSRNLQNQEFDLRMPAERTKADHIPSSTSPKNPVPENSAEPNSKATQSKSDDEPSPSDLPAKLMPPQATHNAYPQYPYAYAPVQPSQMSYAPVQQGQPNSLAYAPVQQRPIVYVPVQPNPMSYAVPGTMGYAVPTPNFSGNGAPQASLSAFAPIQPGQTAYPAPQQPVMYGWYLPPNQGMPPAYAPPPFATPMVAAPPR